MIIVGVGAGPGMMTIEAAKTIGDAKTIYGSQRSIDLARNAIASDCRVIVIEDYKKLHTLPPEAVVLSTGDPMLSGLGYLKGKVIPGISSLQVACARFKLSMLEVVPITAHGRILHIESVAFELKRGKSVFLLIDEKSDLINLCRYLENEGLYLDLAVLTNLGYPEETITIGSTSHPPNAPGLSCVLISKLLKRIS